MVRRRVSRSFWAEASRNRTSGRQGESRTTATAFILADADHLSACAKLFVCAARDRMGRLLRPLRFRPRAIVPLCLIKTDLSEPESVTGPHARTFVGESVSPLFEANSLIPQNNSLITF